MIIMKKLLVPTVLLLLPSLTASFVLPHQQLSASRQHEAPPAVATTSSSYTTKSKQKLHQLHMAASVVDNDNANDSSENNTSEASSQNIFGILSDAVTGAAFGLLHAFDPDPIRDSSKNLRVLWVRALLNQRGEIQDDVAAKFLPPTTRGLVTTDAGSKLFDPIVKFTEWIQARTIFIDEAVEHFLSSPACMNNNDGTPQECNIILFGAGYDTRALRNRHTHGGKINFFEVDLPPVVEGKQKLYEKFSQDHDPEWDDKARNHLIPFDLNQCGGNDPQVLTTMLKEKGGLKEGLPTFIVFEAVLFYVNEDAVRNIFADLSQFCSPQGNKGADAMLCMTDSLKPFVDVPFSNEARMFFDKTINMDLLQHRARWGGAVHFSLASSRQLVVEEETVMVTPEAQEEVAAAKKIESSSPPKAVRSKIGDHVNSRVGGLVNSYTPTQSNNKALLKNPSFDNVWYAVAYPWQIDGYETPLDAALKSKTKKSTKPFATRLWGEPIVVYRDAEGELVAMADVCPHRSVPLSMGSIQNNELVCMYHGWKFGPKGECVDVPTLHTVDDNGEANNKKESAKRFLDGVSKANCGNHKAVVEHEGLVFVWRGNVLEADPKLLPTRRKGDMETVPIDTVLDYAVDYSYIVENNLDSPHLFYLHDGSVPPIESIGMINGNLPKLKLSAFTDDCGMGHLGKLGNGRPKKLLRFDPPNIVRHGGVSGFEEEFHIIPIAPQRTRVLLRQHLPRGPILSTVTGIPGMIPMLTLLVNNWNYHIALEDSCVMIGQANRIEDWGAPRMVVGGLGDDLIKRYWSWRSKAHAALGAKGKEQEEGKQGSSETMKSPYRIEFSKESKGPQPSGIPTGTSFGDDPELVSKIRRDSRLRNIPLVTGAQDVDPETGHAIGSWGIKQSYLQETPAANFPPINYKQYKGLLVFDEFVKNIVTPDKEYVPPPFLDDNNRDTQSSSTPSLKKGNCTEPGFQPV